VNGLLKWIGERKWKSGFWGGFEVFSASFRAKKSGFFPAMAACNRAIGGERSEKSLAKIAKTGLERRSKSIKKGG